MAYNYVRLYEKIIGSVLGKGSISDRLYAVIEECEEQLPHPDWERMRKIDFNTDSQKIKNWLDAAFANSAPKTHREGLWFGLHNPVISGKVSAGVYVSAAPEFDTKSIEWACGIEAPHNDGYLKSAVLCEIYSIAYESSNSLKNDAEYPLALAFGAIAAHDSLLEFALPLGLRGLRGAAVGFDSGDFLFLGKFIENKFIPSVRAG
jgi:hypothetical protein